MRRNALVATTIGMALAGWYAAFTIVAFTVSVARELNGAAEVAAFVPAPQATLVFDRHERPAFSFYTEQRIDVPLDAVAPHMVRALLDIEDRRFYDHSGIDPFRIAGAAWRNVQAGRVVQGGSTITQQLARTTLLTPERTLTRKIREAAISLQLEQRYTKLQILEKYLNTVYFGEGFYGVEAAARGYFGKPALKLEPAEAALLAALVRSPSLDAPCVSPQRAKRRRDLVLRVMHAEGHLTRAELDGALATAIPDRSHDSGVLMAAAGEAGLYFQEEVRRQLVAMFGQERVLRGGLRVHSTLDPDMQAAAESAIRDRVAQIAKGHRRAADLQGSLVAIDPANGNVLALVGGRDFRESPFNRATQARRQAGSAFKPIIYAAALERGYAPGSMLRDLDVPIEAVDGPWLPSGEHEDGEYTLRRALQVSSNRAAAQLLQQVGVNTAVSYAHRLGIASDLPPVPSLALGTGEVTLLELTGAYGAFANRGRLAPPRLILRVEDAAGRTIWHAPGDTTQAIRPSTAFMMSSMLADVVSGGTATPARAAGFRLPAAGKTGTTDDYADAWFIGYTPHLVAGVWFGLDRPAPIMTRGFAGVVAVPAWAKFMRAATKGAKADWFETPADVERVEICRLTGARAAEECRHSIYRRPHDGSEIATPSILPASYPPESAASGAELEPDEPPVYEDLFPLGSVPPELCPVHTGRVSTSSLTPIVDRAIAPDRQTDSDPIVVQRVPRPDGTYRILLTNRNR